MSTLAPSVPRRFGWLRKGVASIGEQGITSLTGFLLQIILLRFLGLEQYGAFSIAFSALMLAAAAAGALSFDPMPIVAGRLEAGILRRYIGQVVRYIAIAAAIIALPLAGAILLLEPGGEELTLPLVAAALAYPFIAVFWALRRGCYVLGSPELGMVAAIAGALATFGLVWIAHGTGILSAATAFAVMGGAAAAAAVVLCRTLGISPAQGEALPRRELIARHRRLGVWLLGTAVAVWVLRNSLPALATSVDGLAAAGAVRAYYNLILPLTQAIAALTAYSTPIVARRYHEAGSHVIAQYGLRLTGLFAGIALVYCGALWAGGGFVVEILYAGEGREFLYILPAFAVIGFVHGSLQGAGVVLTAAGRTRPIFFAQATAAALTVAAAFAVSGAYGLQGIVWAFAGGNVVLWLGIMAAAVRLARRPGHA